MQGDLRLAQEGAQHPMTLTVLQTYFSSEGNINAGEQILPTDADNPQIIWQNWGFKSPTSRNKRGQGHKGTTRPARSFQGPRR
jgi:hypothetical protein